MSLRLPRAPPSRLDLVLAAGLRALDIAAKRSNRESGPAPPAAKRSNRESGPAQPNKHIEDFQQALLRSARDRAALIRVIEIHVLEPASIVCENPLKLRYNPSPSRENLIACPSGESGENGGKFSRYRAEAEIELFTKSGGVLSVIGISPAFDDALLEIVSKTPDSQKRKGYDELLWAVAVIVAHVEEKAISSNVCNWVSAYILLRNFSAQVVYEKDVKTFDRPLGNKEAIRAAKAAHFVEVFGDDENYERAQELLMETAVLCAEAQRI
jgi:hypothetical protein